jgi:hypothetical protein
VYRAPGIPCALLFPRGGLHNNSGVIRAAGTRSREEWLFENL